MKEWLVDTNVLWDVLGADERFGPLSKEVLAECAETGILADFMIGAHAAVGEFVLISRDSGIGMYFDIHILNPDE